MTEPQLIQITHQAEPEPVIVPRSSILVLVRVFQRDSWQEAPRSRCTGRSSWQDAAVSSWMCGKDELLRRSLSSHTASPWHQKSLSRCTWALSKNSVMHSDLCTVFWTVVQIVSAYKIFFACKYFCVVFSRKWLKPLQSAPSRPHRSLSYCPSKTTWTRENLRQYLYHNCSRGLITIWGVTAPKPRPKPRHTHPQPPRTNQFRGNAWWMIC